jgi:hypothetical protein
MLLCKPRAATVNARMAGGYPCGAGAAAFMAVITAFMGGVFTWGVFAVALALGVIPAGWDNNTGWLAALLLGLLAGWPAAMRERAVRREHRRVLCRRQPPRLGWRTNVNFVLGFH